MALEKKKKRHSWRQSLNLQNLKLAEGQGQEWWSRKILGLPLPTDTELQDYTRTTTTHTATMSDHDLKNSRKDFPQLKRKRKNHTETSGRTGGAV